MFSLHNKLFGIYIAIIFGALRIYELPLSFSGKGDLIKKKHYEVMEIYIFEFDIPPLNLMIF